MDLANSNIKTTSIQKTVLKFMIVVKLSDRVRRLLNGRPLNG